MRYTLLIDREVVASIFGEKTKNETFVIYSIKADRRYKGIPQAFLNLMCEHPSF